MVTVERANDRVEEGTKLKYRWEESVDIVIR
jgi:hypothetical protein